MKFALAGKTALITGAASGIGRALALAFAQRGARLALCDIDDVGLAETAGLCERAGATTTTHRLDVADRAAVAAFPTEIRAAHAGLDILVNNAGVAIGGSFAETSPADFDWLLSINLFGVVDMTRAFLPLLKQSPDARLVNICSVFGIIAPPGQTAYCASKFAVRGFSESLRHELDGTSVGVTVVHPGGVTTRIALSARMPATYTADEAESERRRFHRFLKLPPERAADLIVRGIERRRPRILVGDDARIIGLIERILPETYWRVIRRLSP